MALSDGDRALLEFEESWWQRPGTKSAGIRRLGLSPSVYYRRLAVLVDSSEAMAQAPLLVRRLRRSRVARRRVRFEGTALPSRTRR